MTHRSQALAGDRCEVVRQKPWCATCRGDGRLGQDLSDVRFGIQAEQSTGTHNRVHDSGAPSRFGIADEPLVAQPDFGRPDRSLDGVLVDVDVSESSLCIAHQPRPTVVRVGHGLSELAGRQGCTRQARVASGKSFSRQNSLSIFPPRSKSASRSLRSSGVQKQRRDLDAGRVGRSVEFVITQDPGSGDCASIYMPFESCAMQHLLRRFQLG
jgi:hypothetical protein